MKTNKVIVKETKLIDLIKEPLEKRLRRKLTNNDVIMLRLGDRLFYLTEEPKIAIFSKIKENKKKGVKK